MIKIEINPFAAFVPKNASVLIIGSFPGKEQTQNVKEINDEWFYGSKRNQFWSIVSSVYGVELKDTAAKKELFKKLGIAITDVLLKIKRLQNNNLDENLEIVEFNEKELATIISNPKIKKIYFTSKFVERHFKKLFPGITYSEALPSPSPRYARMTLAQKIEHYKNKLPEK